MRPCGAGIQYIKGKVLNAFSASISTAHLLLDICMYQHDLGRRRTANIGEQQEKRRRLYSKAGRQTAFTKGCWILCKAAITYEKLWWWGEVPTDCRKANITRIFKKSKEKLGTSHQSLERTCPLGKHKQEISSYTVLPKVNNTWSTWSSSMTK